MSAIRLTSNAISAIAAMSLALPANADQPQTITMSSRVGPQFRGGDLVGCQLGFEVARNDPEYSRGELVYLTGNLGFKAFDEKELVFTLKLGATTVQARGVFTPPADAYLVDGYSTNSNDLITSIEGEEGFRLFAYSAGDTTRNAVMRGVIQNQQFTFAYAMRPGGLNAIVPVDLRVERLDLDDPRNSVISDNNSQAWAACLEATLHAAKERLYSQMSDEELMSLLAQEEAAEAAMDAAKDAVESVAER